MHLYQEEHVKKAAEKGDRGVFSKPSSRQLSPLCLAAVTLLEAPRAKRLRLSLFPDTSVPRPGPHRRIAALRKIKSMAVAAHCIELSAW